MSNVDKRVVQMEFDNKQFEKDMQATVKSLKNFEKDLNSIGGNTKAFNGLEKGLQNVQSNVKGFNLSPISDAFEKVKVTVSGWEMVAMAAITRVVDGAMNAAQNMARSLIVDPVSQGFSEYELKMNSIQTMMMGSGASLDEVNKKLDELNTYADKTIYSFSDMTQNIGKFINAGVSLDDSVAAIQGVSNVAAISGANTQEASRAMYNFAQALSAGYVKLIDWKSIENANMATVEFKNELLKTAKALGTVVQEGDYYISTTTDANGKVSEVFNATKSFNDSLSAQWMTTEVLTETLKKYTDETTELGKKAFAAAQDVKTFSQLMDTLKEAVGSGWAQTWEIVFGNFDQAKSLWTSISNVVGGFIDKQAKARNEMLKTWASMGGRASLLESFKNLFENISAIVKPIKEAFQEIFPPLTANKLVSLTRSFAALVTKMEITEDEAKEIKDVFKSVFSAIKNSISPIIRAWKDAFPLGTIGGFIKKIASFIGSIIKFGTDLFNSITNNGEVIHKVALTLFTILKIGMNILGGILTISKNIIKFFSPIIQFISKLIGYIIDLSLSFSTIFLKSQNIHDSISKLSKSFSKLISPIKDGLAGAFEKLNPYLDAFKSWADGAIGWLSEKFAGAINIASGWLETLAGKLSGSASGFDSVSNGAKTAGEKLDIYRQKVKGTVGSITDSIKKNTIFQAIWNGVKKVFSTIIEGIKDVVSGVNKTLSPIINKFKESGVLATLGTIISDVASAIGNAVKTIIKSAGPAKEALLEMFGANSLLELLQKFVSMFVQLKLGKLAGSIGGFLDKLAEKDGLLDKIKKSFTSFINGIKKPLDGFQKKNSVFKTFAASVLMLSGALYIVSKIPTEQLGPVVAALISVVISFSTMMAILSKVVSKNENASKQFAATALLIYAFGKVVKTMIVGFSILVLVINKVKPKSILYATLVISAISILIGAFAILFAAFAKSNINEKQILAYSLLIKVISSAIKSIALVIGILSLFNSNKIMIAGAVVGILATIFMVGLGLLFSKGSQYGMKASQIAAMSLLMKVISGAIKSIALVIGILSLFDTKKVLLASLVVVIITAMIAGLIALTKLIGKDEIKNILSLSVFVKVISSALKHLSIVIAILSLIGFEKVKEGVSILALITILVTGLVLLTKIVDPSKMEAASMGILEMSAAISIIALAVIALSKIKVEDAATSLGLLAAAIVVLGLTAVGVSRFAKHLDILGDVFVKFGIAAALFGAGVFLIVKATKTLSAIGPNGIQMMVDMLTALITNLPRWIGILVTGLISELTKMIPSIAKSLVNMVVAIIEIMTNSASLIVSAIIKLFKAIANALKTFSGEFKIEDLFWAVQSIALIAGLIYILQILSSDMKSALKGIALMALVLGMLVGAMAIINMFQNADKMSEILQSIAKTLLSLAGLFTILASITLIFDKATAGKGINIGAFLKVILAFAIVILAMVALFTIIGAVTNLLNEMGFDVIACVNKAAEVMQAVGSVLGSFMGGIISAFLGAIEDKDKKIEVMLGAAALILALEPLVAALPILGTALVAFGAILAIIDSIFGTGTSMRILELVRDVMPVIAEALGAFVGTLIKKVLEIVTGAIMESMKSFATGMSEFMDNLQPFLNAVQQINGSTLKKVGILAAIILAMVATELISGLVHFLSVITLSSWSFKDFAKQLSDMAPYLVDFSNSLEKGQFNGDLSEKAANAALMMANVANNLPKSGGLWQIFAGNTMSMSDFGNKLEGLGSSLVRFAKKVNTLTPGQVDSIGTAAIAVKELTEVAKNMPKSGGLWQRIVGETTNMDDFGNKLEGLGKSLVKFAGSVSGINSDQVNSINTVIPIIQALVDISKSMPQTGGVWQRIVGESMDMSDFAEKLTHLGEGFAGFAAAISTISSDGMSKAETATAICKSLAEISNTIGENKSGGLAEWFGGSSSEDIESWGKKLPTLGEGFSEFATSVQGIKKMDNISDVVDAIKILSEITNIKDADVNAIKMIAESIGALAYGVEGTKYNGVSDIIYIYNAFGKNAKTIAERSEYVKNAIKAIIDIVNIPAEGKNFNKDTLDRLGALIHGDGKKYQGLSDFKSLANAFGDKNTDAQNAWKRAEAVGKAIKAIVDIVNMPAEGKNFVKDTLDRLGALIHGDGKKYQGISDFKSLADAFGDKNTDAQNAWKRAEAVGKAIKAVVDIVNIPAEGKNFVADTLDRLGALIHGDGDQYQGISDFKLVADAFGDQNTDAQNAWKRAEAVGKAVKAIVDIVNIPAEGKNFVADTLDRLGALIHGDDKKYNGISDMLLVADAFGDQNTDAQNAWKRVEAVSKAINAVIDIVNTKFTGGSGNSSLATLLARIGDFYYGSIGTGKYKGIGDFLLIANAFGDTKDKASAAKDRLAIVAEAISLLIEAFNNSINFDGSDIESFTDAITAISNLSVDTIKEDMITRSPEVVNAANNMIYSLGKTFLDKQDALKKNVTTLLGSISKAVNDSEPSLKKSMGDLVQFCITSISQYNSQDPTKPSGFYAAGQNSVNGYVQGIKSKLENAFLAGKSIGTNALKGTESALDSHSPSREYGNLAYYSILGFVNTLKNKANIVFNAGEDLGQNALNGTKGIISNISNLINSDMNLQPVISPILDLSDVSTQSGRINGILNAGTSVMAANGASNLIEQGRMIRLDARLNQNGSPDVVDAVTNLTKRMDSLEKTIVNRPIMLDKTKVSKELTPEIDKNLGRRAYYSRRGN